MFVVYTGFSVGAVGLDGNTDLLKSSFVLTFLLYGRVFTRFDCVIIFNNVVNGCVLIVLCIGLGFIRFTFVGSIWWVFTFIYCV